MRIALLLAALFTVVAPAENPVQILTTGLFHQDEFKAEAGPDWWGIFPEGEGFTLQPAPVTVTIEQDGIMDNDNEKTGRVVNVPQKTRPVLLLRGLPNLTEGPLDAAELPAGRNFLYPGQHLSLSSGPDKRVAPMGVTAFGSARDDTVWGNVFFHDYQFRLITGRHPNNTTQAVGNIDPFVLDGIPHLVWAGDIDRDGNFDLLFDFTDHYNKRHYVLFVSSAAKEGELVGKVAELVTTGC